MPRDSNTPVTDKVIYEWMRLKREDIEPGRLLVSFDVWCSLVRESVYITGFLRTGPETAEFMGMPVVKSQREGWHIEVADRAGSG